MKFDSSRRSTLRHAIPWIVLVLFLPVGFLGLVIQPNEYKSWGGSGVDCDGPIVMVFAQPAAVVYALLALVFLHRAIRRRAWMPVLAALFCAMLVPPLVTHVREARAELADPGYQQVCGQ